MLPYKFTAKELDDETGLYYYGARYLNPRTSRWISADPAGFGLINPKRKGFNFIESQNWYSYVGNNPIKYIDPTGMASILSRPINKGSRLAYNVANFFGEKLGIFTHGLVDKNGLDYVEAVSQYSGSHSGFTKSDTNSQIRRYKIKYSGMDDTLTNEAIENVLSTEQFGSGDNEKAKSLYKIFENDCNDYTDAVFSEYKSLWMEDQGAKNEGIEDFDVNTAWDAHYDELTKDQGQYVDFTPTETEGTND